MLLALAFVWGWIDVSRPMCMPLPDNIHVLRHRRAAEALRAHDINTASLYFAHVRPLYNNNTASHITTRRRAVAMRNQLHV